MMTHAPFFRPAEALTPPVIERLDPPFGRFALAALTFGAVLLVVAPVVWPASLGAARWAPPAVFAMAAAAAVASMRLSYPHRRLGAANVLTLARLAAVSLLAAPLAAPPAFASDPALGWLVAVVAGAALALDGLDGPLARRSGLVSRFGARFDVETDAALALALATLAAAGGSVGPWVVALGLPRYAFLLAGLAAPWLRAELPERRWRKAVCVLQLATLIALQPPLLAPPLATLAALVAVSAVAISFATDLLWLRRRARA